MAVKDSRPWGSFEVLYEHLGCKVKRLIIHPGCRISLQRHHARQEHWYVVRGEAHMELHGQSRTLQTGGSVDIPIGAWHRLTNLGQADLEVIEVQTGVSTSELDIERAEDDYGRCALRNAH